MTIRPQARWSATFALLHPAWWLSLFVLLLNDHLLKGGGIVWPALTGKISDFAGLLMAPAVIAVVLGARSYRVFVSSHLIVGAVFSALKLSEGCAATWCDLGAALGWSWKVVCDPTDLVALPMLAVSMWLFGPRLGQPTDLRASGDELSRWPPRRPACSVGAARECAYLVG